MIHSPVLRLPRLKLLHHGPCGHKPHHTQNRTPWRSGLRHKSLAASHPTANALVRKRGTHKRERERPPQENGSVRGTQKWGSLQTRETRITQMTASKKTPQYGTCAQCRDGPKLATTPNDHWAHSQVTNFPMRLEDISRLSICEVPSTTSKQTHPTIGPALQIFWESWTTGPKRRLISERQRGDRVEAIALHQAALVLAAQDLSA